LQTKSSPWSRLCWRNIARLARSDAEMLCESSVCMQSQHDTRYERFRPSPRSRLCWRNIARAAGFRLQYAVPLREGFVWTQSQHDTQALEFEPSPYSWRCWRCIARLERCWLHNATHPKCLHAIPAWHPKWKVRVTVRALGPRLDLGCAGAGRRYPALRVRRVGVDAPDAGVPLRAEGVVDGLAARLQLRTHNRVVRVRVSVKVRVRIRITTSGLEQGCDRCEYTRFAQQLLSIRMQT